MNISFQYEHNDLMLFYLIDFLQSLLYFSTVGRAILELIRYYKTLPFNSHALRTNRSF